ncbi:hypothetical protein [Pectinatus sottacetonis]|uniref:hypothetical protein n=1 Tax=Pectinatus sottacetonis TaxID=1002795 RepID=UPI0018C84D3D|nr:hypothetical protein [Pectinatus sottacetonis]
MNQKDEKSIGEILAQLKRNGFRREDCPICHCQYILAAKTDKYLKLTCRECGYTQLFNIRLLFNHE